MDGLSYLLEGRMKRSVFRILERLGGGALLLLGLAWLILGLRSLTGEQFAVHGVFVVVIIAAALILSGALLAKPRASQIGRVLAIVVCILGSLREMMLMDHQETTTAAFASWIGTSLLVLYVFIAIIVILNYVAGRRTAAA
jgi:hypothetical protein